VMRDARFFRGDGGHTSCKGDEGRTFFRGCEGHTSCKGDEGHTSFLLTGDDNDARF
jgi:hypothetical protein